MSASTTIPTPATATSATGRQNIAAPRKGDAWLGRMGINIGDMRKKAAPPAPPPLAGARSMPPLPATPNGQATPPAPPNPGAQRMPPLPATPPVPPPRPTTAPGEAAYRAALDAAKTVLDDAATAVDRRIRNAEVPKVRAPYDAASAAVAAAEAKGDYLTATELLKTKVKAAELVAAAGDFDYASGFGPRIRANISRVDVVMAQSGVLKGLEQAAADFRDARQQLAAAVAKQDYQAAIDIRGDVTNKANALYVPYETLLLAERDKPLFERAEKLFRQRKLPADLAASRQQYEQAVKNQERGQKASNWGQMRSGVDARIDIATTAIKRSQQAAVDDWFNGHQATPAAGSGGGIATGLATMPDLSQMDEGKKLEVMASAVGMQQSALETMVKERYARALADGVKLELTPAQMVSAMGYSGNAYDDMNGLLRGTKKPGAFSDEGLDKIKVQIALLEETLDRLPTYDSAAFPLFRWETPAGDYLQSRYSEGTVFEIKEFWSSGAGGGSAVGASPSTEILIWGKKKSRAKDISRLSMFDGTEGTRADGGKLKGQGGGEVLFPPGTKFKTLKFNAFDASGKPLPRVDSKDRREVDISYRVEIIEL